MEFYNSKLELLSGTDLLVLAVEIYHEAATHNKSGA